MVDANRIIAYAGHFIVNKDFIFDPLTREPVLSVALLSLEQSMYPILPVKIISV